MQTYSFTETRFTGYTCVLARKPEDPIGPNNRRFPRTCGELHLTQEDAAECTYFANADEAAFDAVRWQVYPIPNVLAPLRAYEGDEEPLFPDGAVTTTTTKTLKTGVELKRATWCAGCNPATCNGPAKDVYAAGLHSEMQRVVTFLHEQRNDDASMIASWLTNADEDPSPAIIAALERAWRKLDNNGHIGIAFLVRRFLTERAASPCGRAASVATEAVSC
jgi:hypothetical protein